MQLIGGGQLAEAEAVCRQVLEQKPLHDQALHVLGLVAYLRSDYDTAKDHFERAVQIDESNPQYLCNLAETHRRLKNPQEALIWFERSVVAMPEFLKAHLGAGNALRDMGRYIEAVSKFRLSLAINPNFAEGYHYLGVTYMEQELVDDAIPLLRKAVAIRPQYVEAQLSLANALEASGQVEEALSIFYEMIEQNPSNIAVHNNVGNILKNLGRMDEAVEHYQKALEADPDHTPAYYNLSRTRVGSGEAEIEQMEALLKEPQVSPERRLNLHFALGKIYDDQGQYDKAFAHFQAGNRLDDRVEAFDVAGHTRAINRLIGFFSPQFFASRAGLGCESDLPVFIVGMPRSGTTLVEQTLASHPQVFGAGELNHMGQIIQNIPKKKGMTAGYPEFAGLLDAISTCKLGEQYVKALKAMDSKALRITDKMPGNFANLGFIALLLPRARIIHCHRDPLDVCLSCYFQHFTKVMPFSRELSDLGLYYRDYERLMAHWQAALPMQILDVKYEDMIADHEGMSRKIVEFAGLDWDEACLSFHETERAVKTASSWQVRQPIYSSSVARWRNFESHLGPLREALGDSVTSPSGRARQKRKKPAAKKAKTTGLSGKPASAKKKSARANINKQAKKT